jgi:uncharacterized membrane-anchored protein YhcB (DUF1043 family)
MRSPPPHSLRDGDEGQEGGAATAEAAAETLDAVAAAAAAAAAAEQAHTREVLDRLRPTGSTQQLSLQEELEALKRELGPDHRETLEFMARAGQQRLAIESYADAVDFLGQAVAGYSSTLGPEHKKSQRLKKSLARARRLEAARAKKGVGCKWLLYLLLYVPLVGSLCGAVWSYTPPWLRRRATLGGGQLLSCAHEGPCVAAGLCTPYATQLARLYSSHYHSRHRDVERREKLRRIPQLLKKWHGKEMALVAAVAEKYGTGMVAAD